MLQRFFLFFEIGHKPQCKQKSKEGTHARNGGGSIQIIPRAVWLAGWAPYITQTHTDGSEVTIESNRNYLLVIYALGGINNLKTTYKKSIARTKYYYAR